MRSLVRVTLALVCLCAAAHAQSDIWKFSRTATLSGTSVAFTVALPGTGNNELELLDYTLQCTTDCSVSTERNGSAPTATAGTWRPENYDTAPKVSNVVQQPKGLIYYASDSTSGSLQDEPFIFPAAALVPWDLTGIVLTGSGATNNWTVRIGPFTGTYRFQIRVRIRR